MSAEVSNILNVGSDVWRLATRRIPMATLTASFVYEALAEGDSYLFETGTRTADGVSPSHAYIATACDERIEVEARRVRLFRSGSIVFDEVVDDPISLLRGISVPLADLDDDLPPFCGGLFGYFGFEVCELFEPSLGASIRQPTTFDVPSVVLLVTRRLLVFDYARHEIVLIARAGQDSVSRQTAIDWLGHVESHLRSATSALAATEQDRLKAPADAASLQRLFTRPNFEAGVRRIKEQIAEGDVMQVVLAQSTVCLEDIDTFAFYNKLLANNPSPYAYHLRLGDVVVVGSSPEMLVRCIGDRLESRPMAGTRRRGTCPAEDEALGAELRADEKETAEHVMLIDLARNDLGRIALPGSVRVDEMMVIEKYSHVMHLVSKVAGTKLDGVHPIDVIGATFPAGTLSGAPKIKAIEILQGIEPSRRGIYGGCIGYIDVRGNIDQAIAIRSAVIHRGEIKVQAGAGIVMDSSPANEWQETIAKSDALWAALASVPAQSEERPCIS